MNADAPGTETRSKHPYAKRLSFLRVYRNELEIIQKDRGVSQQPPLTRLDDLIGLALSGGGIRSATFGLGVLEALKDRKLLKQVDYLSSVSGGGYISAWLSANCVRNSREGSDWLSKGTSWNESIAHLRRYSNYLSPRIGVFSADTWVMGAVWLRNTLLIQLPIFALMALICAISLAQFFPFHHYFNAFSAEIVGIAFYLLAMAGVAGNYLHINEGGGIPYLRNILERKNWRLAVIPLLTTIGLIWHIQTAAAPDEFNVGLTDWKTALPTAMLLLAASVLALPLGILLLNRCWPGNDPPERIDYTQTWVQIAIVIPIMISNQILAAALWQQSKLLNVTFTNPTFGNYLSSAWRSLPTLTIICAGTLWLLAFSSLRKWNNPKLSRFWMALLLPLPAGLLFYILWCTGLYLLAGKSPSTPYADWYALIWAPVFSIGAFALAAILLIGLIGCYANDSTREWWSRLTAWTTIYCFAWTMACVLTVYGGQLPFLALDSLHDWARIGTLITWLLTVGGGLAAGNSKSTNGLSNSETQQSFKTIVFDGMAKLAPFIFILGVFITIAALMHVLQLGLSSIEWTDVSNLTLNYWQHMSDVGQTHARITPLVILALVSILALLGCRIDVNEFSLNQFYRSRLARCYLGASRFHPNVRKPQKFTGFDNDDDLYLTDLVSRNLNSPSNGCPRWPIHLINCTLNLGGSSDLSMHTRHGASFTFTPYSAGTTYRLRDSAGRTKRIGYLPMYSESILKRRTISLGQAISISGAAASPNSGYHTSPVVAFMLTLFNLRLGWWYPSPRNNVVTSSSPPFSLVYLIRELFGGAHAQSDYLMLSDGGHFDNMAAYELVKRRCRVIIISDGECDPELHMEGLATFIRMCNVDFGYTITLDTDPLRPEPGSPWSKKRYVIGRIRYSSDDDDAKKCEIPDGILIYLKASMNGKENLPIRQYKDTHPQFPHETTLDQFYDDVQFESYRQLGKEVAMDAFQYHDSLMGMLELLDQHP